MRNASGKVSLTPAQVVAVEGAYTVYANTGTGGKGWVFQPIGYDASFELYSERYATRSEAVAAAYADLPNLAADAD